MIILFICGILVGSLAGYLVGSGQQPSVQSPLEKLFAKYADDLGMNSAKFSSCFKAGKYAAKVNTDARIASAIGISGTPAFILNGRMFSGAVPYTGLAQFLDAELKNSTNRSLALTLINENDSYIGKKDAPLVIIEFSDFQCYYCRNFTIDTFGLLKKNYIDTGKVLFYYKHFPLASIHSNAEKAAEAAECGREQGKFWEYYEVLFEKQSEWGSAA